MVTKMAQNHTDNFQLLVMSMDKQWVESFSYSVENASQLWVSLYPSIMKVERVDLTVSIFVLMRISPPCLGRGIH